MFELLTPSELGKLEIHGKSYCFVSELQTDFLTYVFVSCVKQIFIVTRKAAVFSFVLFVLFVLFPFPFPLLMLCLNKALKASLVILKLFFLLQEKVDCLTFLKSNGDKYQ